ncbi:hypothetical protein K439DRAFT_300209 [Ramaria rubella]|nr:hypothetical protein K439DRAFT_300209 [Ramaria rubella]
MAQPWQQGQPGFQQYPMQTGIPPNFQQQQGFGGGLQPQPTGFPQQRPGGPGFQPQQTGFQQPQQTGFQLVQQGFQQQPQAVFQQPQQTGFQQPQQTGFPGGGLGYQPTGFQGGGSGFQPRAPPPPPPVPQIPSRFQGQPQSQLQQQQPNAGMLGGGLQQQRSFLSPSPGLVPQQTGFVPSGGLVPQMTGFVDPRLQMMGSTFMPANLSAPYAPSGVPQFASVPQQQQGLSLQQSFQQHNQDQRGTAAPKVPWALSKAERKQYDQIFRAWDTNGTGFISGETALQVFGQSGLEKNDMARIWSLADQDDRGKLGLAEFHVAMGLIYRRLNGNEIPEQLPPELVPPSSRDLDSSVDFVKGLLANDGHTRSTNGVDEPSSRLPVRSFNGSASENANTRKDGTIYRHNEDEVSSYKPSNRHIDRRTVRTGAESPSTDLNEMRRQLENTSKMLEKATAESASRTAEDEALDKEMEDLRYRVRRVQDDLDYVSRGPRSFSKDEERRKLERDLLHLMHERLPEVERKIEERDRRKAREKEDWARARDRGNDKYSRFDDGYSSRRDRYRDEDDDRGYKRGTFDRDELRPRSRNDIGDRDRPRSRNDNGDKGYGRSDRDYDKDRDSPYGGRDRNRDSPLDRSREARPRSPPVTTRSPPPAPPPASSTSRSAPPRAPTASPAPNTKSMTPDERSAFIRAEAQRRMQERMRALGVASPSSTPSVDSSVEDRLAADRREAEEKAKQAEKDAEERERVRKERLESAKALKDGQEKPNAPARAPAPQSTTPKAKAPAPPPPVRKSAPRPPVAARAPAPAPKAAPAPAAPSPPDPDDEALRAEDAAFRAREEALKEAREAREARFRELQEQEEEQRRAEEEYQARRQAFLDAKANASRGPPPPPPAARSRAAPPAPAPVRKATSPAPAPPPAPPPASSPAPATTSSASRATSQVPLAPPSALSPPIPSPPTAITPPANQAGTNPFNRLLSQGGAAISPSPSTGSSSTGGTNPFFRPPPPVTTPTPPPVKSTYTTAPTDSDDGWDDLKEKEEDDSSEDEINKSRGTRDMLAQKIFGGMMPSRGESPATPTAGSPAPIAMSPPPAPTPPPAPPAPPAAPPAPPAPSAPSAPPPPALGGAPPADRGALLSQIASGTPRLRKTKTNDRSTAAISGVVLGDAAPPPHINTQLSPSRTAESLVPESFTTESTEMSRHSNRQSVDWQVDLAAEGYVAPKIPVTVEEEEEYETPVPIPDIHVDASATVQAVETVKDPLEDVDQGKEYRVRSLYPYEGQRTEDLSFDENVLIKAYPSKSGGDWWYGTLVKEGRSGFFPSTYVLELENVKARALYAYAGEGADELPFAEGEELTIIDRSEEDWWKTERDGIIFIVPAAYLEVNSGTDRITSTSKSATQPPTPKHEEPPHNPSPLAKEVTVDDASSEEYLSFEEDSDSESEESEQGQSEEQRQAEYEARELERQRVLSAAGLIVKHDHKTAPRPPPRTKSLRTHRPAPATPHRLSQIEKSRPDRDLPPVPVEDDVPPAELILHVDDAFDRYETFKINLGQRSSTASASSYETGPSSPGASSFSKDETRSHSYSSLLNFLGRRTPGNDSDKRLNLSNLTISAPILNGSKNPSRESSPAFGSSWSSLVDKTALDGIPPDERRRQEVIFELIATESAYVRDLQLIVETFYGSMLPMLDSKATTVIFANIEDILLTNTTFLSSLEERQKQCRLYIDNIGDIVEKHMFGMGVYMQYCVNTGAAIKILQSLRDSNPDLAAHLQRLRDDPSSRGLDLSSYLLTPMQRITRYPLLVRQIIGQTHHQPERGLLEASIAEVERVLDLINESIRDQEGNDRLRQISQSLWIDQGRLDLTEPTRYMGPRKLIKEGPLSKTKSNRKLHGFLCSDILVLTEEAGKSLYRMPIPLSELQVREGTGRNDLEFKIVLAYPRGGDVVNLRASSARDAQNWMRAIEQARLKCISAEKRAARRSRGSLG